MVKYLCVFGSNLDLTGLRVSGPFDTEEEAKACLQAECKKNMEDLDVGEDGSGGDFYLLDHCFSVSECQTSDFETRFGVIKAVDLAV